MTKKHEVIFTFVNIASGKLKVNLIQMTILLAPVMNLMLL